MLTPACNSCTDACSRGQIHDEFAKSGRLEELNVCENLGDHIVGNVYIKFEDEENAAEALQVGGGPGRFPSTVAHLMIVYCLPPLLSPVSNRQCTAVIMPGAFSRLNTPQ